MEMTLNEVNIKTSTRWKEKFQLFAFFVTEDKHTVCYRLELDSKFVPHSLPFQNPLNENLN